MVEERIVAAQRQLEAVLALGGAVAGAGVAAHLRQGRHHVADEADLVPGLLPLTFTGMLAVWPASADLEHAVAVGHRPDHAGRTDADDLVRPVEPGQARDVDAFPRFQTPVSTSWLYCVGIAKVDLGGLRFDARSTLAPGGSFSWPYSGTADRPSRPPPERGTAIVAGTTLVAMIQFSLERTMD